MWESALVSVVGLWRFALVRWSALAAFLAVYAVASLSPFDWTLPERLKNHALRQAYGWSFASAGIVVAEPPLAWFDAAVNDETLDVSLEVRPREGRQSGPARLLTVSEDAFERNLTLAQDGSDLVIRVRSEDSDSNGLHDGQPTARVENVFEAGKWVAIDARLRPGRLSITIDGVPKLAADLPRWVLDTWDPDFGLALGNEMTCNRPWLGDIRKAVVAGPRGAVDYAMPERVEVPATCWTVSHPPTLVPFRNLNRTDAFLNILMYLPLGSLLGLMARVQSARTFGLLVLAIAGISLSFETAQLLLPPRFPSINDIICNVLGGAVGIWLGFWVNERLARWLCEGRRSRGAASGP